MTMLFGSDLGCVELPLHNSRTQELAPKYYVISILNLNKERLTKECRRFLKRNLHKREFFLSDCRDNFLSE